MIYKIIILVTVIIAVLQLARPFKINYEKEKDKFIKMNQGLSPFDKEQKLVRDITRQLVQYSSNPNLDYTVNVLRTPVLTAVNFHPHHIFISRGLLFMAADVDRIAAVLAHELVHAMEQHHKRRSGDQKVMSVIEFLLTFVGIGTIASQLVRYGSRYTIASRERDEEREADAKSLLLLEKAGFRPEAVKEMLQRMNDLEKQNTKSEQTLGEDLFASHPSLQERIDNL